jgi:hypothetical protein
MTTTDAPIARRLAIAISVASAAITIAVIVTAGTVLGWFRPEQTQRATDVVEADAAVPEQLIPVLPEPQPVTAVAVAPPEVVEDPVIVYADEGDDDDDDDEHEHRHHHDDDDDDDHDEHEHRHHHEDD